MQVTDFINSKSIVRYLQDIHYVFSPLEEAFIAVQSSRWLYGKAEFLRQLVASIEDFVITGQNFTFHELLNRQLDVWSNLADHFDDNDGWWQGFDENDEELSEPSTHLDDVVFSAYRKLPRDHNFYYIKKFPAEGGTIVTTLNRALHTTDIEDIGKNESPYSKFLRNNFFVLPVPFRCGDIVSFKQGEWTRKGVIKDVQCADFVSGEMYNLKDVPMSHAAGGVRWHQFAWNGDIRAATGLPHGINYLDLEMDREYLDEKGEVQHEFARLLRGDGDLTLLLNCQLRLCKAFGSVVWDVVH